MGKNVNHDMVFQCTNCLWCSILRFLVHTECSFSGTLRWEEYKNTQYKISDNCVTKLVIFLKKWHDMNIQIESNWITLFKVGYLIVKLHNSSHLLKVCLNNANQPKIILTVTIKIKQIRILKGLFTWLVKYFYIMI